MPLPVTLERLGSPFARGGQAELYLLPRGDPAGPLVLKTPRPDAPPYAPDALAIDGDSLGAWRCRRVPRPTEVAQAVRNAACVLGLAHRQGVVHRDLSPANLLRQERGCVWVIDWAQACRADPDTRPKRRLAATPGFTAPEVLARAKGALHPRCDVWSLGRVLEVLLGWDQARCRPQGEVAPLPGGHLDAAPPDLCRIVRTAVHDDPEARQPDALVLAEQLDRWLRGPW